MSEFLQRVADDIQARRLLARGQNILVAVSGGVDSMVLFEVLNSLASKNRWRLCVAHFNHHLRGRASDADERFVRRAAEKMGVPCFCGGAEVKSLAVQAKLSVEMAARNLRHEFLARIAREQKISTIALAHHADDQVELFFLRVLRGAGSDGLAGMKRRSPSPADKTISLVRPLLEFSKAEILAFARAGKIQFRDDASNASVDFLRNRIRHELLPLLRQKYQPGLNKNILRVMEIVGAEADVVLTAAARRPDAGIGADGFAEQPVAIQRRILQRELTAADVPVDFGLVEQLRSAAGKWVSISPDVSIARNDWGTIIRRQETTASFDHAESPLSLRSGAGRANVAGKTVRWKIRPQKKFLLPPPKRGVEHFDADKVGDEVILRHWRPGDRFQPIGMESAVKLQDLFVNAKIPAADRRKRLVATTATGEIFWVEGLRIGEPFKLTTRTKRHLSWNWQ